MNISVDNTLIYEVALLLVNDLEQNDIYAYITAEGIVICPEAGQERKMNEICTSYGLLHIQNERVPRERYFKK